MLALHRVVKKFGGVTAVNEVDLELQPGEITALVGANGAGKTTLLDCISGHLQVTSGLVELDRIPITTIPAWQRARLGVLRGFQDNRLFPALTVAETIKAAQYRVFGHGLFGAFIRTPSARRRVQRASHLVNQILDQFNLTDLALTPVSDLSLGMSKVVMIAALMASDPKWILLDEPSAGLARKEVDGLALHLKKLLQGSQQRGLLIVEHDAAIVAATADRVVVLERGSVADDLRPSDAGWERLLGQERTGEVQVAMGTVPSAQSADAFAVAAQRSEEGGDRLRAVSLDIRYGAFLAVADASLEVVPGRIACLVGTNGAGKSSILRAMAGLVKPSHGDVLIDQSSILRLPTHRRTKMGVVMIPSGRGLLASLTVHESMELANDRAKAYGLANNPLVVDPFELFPQLATKQSQLAGTLSGGEQQMLAIARVLY